MGSLVKLRRFNEIYCKNNICRLTRSLDLTVLLLVGCLVFFLSLTRASAETGYKVTTASTANAVQPEVITDPTATPDCGLAWRVVPAPNLSTFQNEHFGVDAISANDVWVVGLHSTSTLGQSLALHWDGS
jgi:hypothetical protein